MTQLTLHTPHVTSSTASLSVCVVSELYYPEETSTGRILTQIAEGLASDATVQAVCGQATYSQRGIKAPWREERRGVEIHRCWSTTLNKDSLLLRLINAVTLSVSIFVKLLTLLQPGMRVLVVTTPPSLPLIAFLACWIRNAPMSILVHDVYPEVAVAAGLVRPRSWLVRRIDALMSFLLRKSDTVIVLGRDMHELIAAKLPAEQHDKIWTIPNWAETDAIRPNDAAGRALLLSFGLGNKFVIQYSGNMGRSHNVEDLVACAERLEHNGRLHFLLIGSGAKKRWLNDTVADRGLDNVTVRDPLRREQLEAGLNACDVSIVTFVEGMAGISVPCRMYNILAAGKPIVAVCDRHSELARVVEEERIGWVVAPGAVETLAALLETLPNRRTELQAMGKRARAAAEAKYRFDVVRTAYGDWLHDRPSQPTAVRKAA